MYKAMIEYDMNNDGMLAKIEHMIEKTILNLINKNH